MIFVVKMCTFFIQNSVCSNNWPLCLKFGHFCFKFGHFCLKFAQFCLKFYNFDCYSKCISSYLKVLVSSSVSSKSSQFLGCLGCEILLLFKFCSSSFHTDAMVEVDELVDDELVEPRLLVELGKGSSEAGNPRMASRNLLLSRWPLAICSPILAGNLTWMVSWKKSR